MVFHKLCKYSCFFLKGLEVTKSSKLNIIMINYVMAFRTISSIGFNVYIYSCAKTLCYNKSEQRNYEQHHKKSLPNNYMWPTLVHVIFEKEHFLLNTFDQKFTFNYSSFRHFVHEVNNIWYLRNIALRGYQISLTVFLNGRIASDWKYCKSLIKIILQERVPF